MGVNVGVIVGREVGLADGGEVGEDEGVREGLRVTTNGFWVPVGAELGTTGALDG